MSKHLTGSFFSFSLCKVEAVFPYCYSVPKLWWSNLSWLKSSNSWLNVGTGLFGCKDAVWGESGRTWHFITASGSLLKSLNDLWLEAGMCIQMTWTGAAMFCHDAGINKFWLGRSLSLKCCCLRSLTGLSWGLCQQNPRCCDKLSATVPHIQYGVLFGRDSSQAL